MRPFLLLLLAVGLSETAQAANDPCVAANAKESYVGFETVEKSLKDDVVAYRKLWREYCGKRTPAKVLGLFEALTAVAPKIQAQVAKTNDEKTLDALVKKLPDFVPAVSCFVYDGGSNCDASLEEFAVIAAAGTDEDKLFAETHRDVRGYGTLAPWYEQTWDYGGCIRYGEYDWVATLKKIDAAREKIQGKTYTVQLDEMKHGLLDVFAGDVTRQGTCSCKAKGAPLKDLPKVAAYLEKGRDSKEYLGQVRELLQGLKSKKFKMRSQAEAHCSGG